MKKGHAALRTISEAAGEVMDEASKSGYKLGKIKNRRDLILFALRYLKSNLDHAFEEES